MSGKKNLTLEDMEAQAAEIRLTLLARVKKIVDSVPPRPWWDPFGYFTWQPCEEWVARMEIRAERIAKVYVECARKIVAGEQTGAYLSLLELQGLRIEFWGEAGASADRWMRA